MDTPYHVEMLGRFAVHQGNREITRFRTRKTASLLANLAFYKSRAQPRDGLLERFWPASTLDAARTNLSVALNALRHQLEPPGVPAGAVIIADRSQVLLNPIAFTTDVEEFETILREAQRGTEAEERFASWRAAADLYRGDLLPGDYEDWIIPERERLRDAYLTVLRQLIKQYAETRQYSRAIEYAHRSVQMAPLRETSYRDLMRLYMAAGRPGDALYQYQELERLLQQELQTAPSAATRELAEQLRHTSPMRPKATEVRATDTTLQVTTVKDQRPSPGAQRRMFRLPLQFSRFFGREEEIARLEAMLKETCDGSFRLFTLTGPGGTGKTRLSVEVARRAREAFAGGLWFVPLSELDDPRRLGETLLDALELPRQAEPAALDQVIAFLSGLERPSLLILDSFEQIAGAAPIVWTMLNRVPSLQCLVTSRRPLALPGERQVPVLPLPVPDAAAKRVQGTGEPEQQPEPQILLSFPSVALFVDRAQSVQPEFQITPRNARAIAAICETLEGIPLAIELAAARAKVLTPSQTLERLAERFDLLVSRRVDKGDHHRSLWAAIDWSYHLLPSGLQRFFARLSVFRGGWSLEAAESVCEEPAALDCLSQLQGHSLIVAEESSTAMRFRMLETLREFAAEQLREEEGTAWQERHLAFYLTLAEAARPHLGGPEQAVWLDRLETEHDNLRAALRTVVDDEGAEKGDAGEMAVSSSSSSALRLSGALQQFWWTRGHLSEGREWYERVLALDGAKERTKARARVLNGAGSLAWTQGDYSAARALFEESLSIDRELGNKPGIAGSVNNLGLVAREQGDYVAARAFFEESLSIDREFGNEQGLALSLSNLGLVALDQADYAWARSMFERSLSILREMGDKRGIANSLNNLGGVAFEQGDYSATLALIVESLTIKKELGDRQGIAYALVALAELAFTEGRSAIRHPQSAIQRAARLWGGAERLREEIGARLSPNELAEYERQVASAQVALGREAFAAAWAEGRLMAMEQAIAYALEETEPSSP